MEFVGLRSTQFDEKVANGELPRPIKISDSGRAVAWLLSELMEWRQSRIAKREQAASAPSKKKEKKAEAAR